ncbi:MAG: ABC transporter substrate-binding protein [Candidatus Ozemobacteraceae bacterium]
MNKSHSKHRSANVLNAFFLCGALLLSSISLFFSVASAQTRIPHEGNNASASNAVERERPQGLAENTIVRLKHPPERIVALFPQSLALIALFGLADKMVGAPTAKISPSMHEHGFLQSLFPGLMKLSDVGFPGKPNMEMIIGLNPDLIILPYFHQQSDRLFNLLKRPQFRMFGTFSSVDHWLEAVEKFGMACGKPKIAQAYISWFNRISDLVTSRLKSSNEPPAIGNKVLRVVKSGKRYLVYGNRLALGNEILRTCGLDALGADANISGDGMFSIEEALQFDPDLIFIDGTAHSTPQAEVELTEPFWKQLRAYREKRVYIIPVDDASCFMTGWYFNLSAPLGLLWTAKIAYPKLFEDIDLDKEAATFYKTFFTIDVAEMRKANANVKIKEPREGPGPGPGHK